MCEERGGRVMRIRSSAFALTTLIVEKGEKCRWLGLDSGLQKGSEYHPPASAGEQAQWAARPGEGE